MLRYYEQMLAVLLPHLVLQGSLSLGTMLAMSALAGAFLHPLGSLVSTALEFQQLGSYIDRVDEVLSREPEQAAALPAAPALRGALTRVNVHCPATDVCTATCPNSTTIVFAMGGHGNNLTTNVAHTSGICGAQQEWMGSCLGGTSCTVDSGCTSVAPLRTVAGSFVKAMACARVAAAAVPGAAHKAWCQVK